jgi:hypothetical protein
VDDLKAAGWTILGIERSVKTPLGVRRVDIVAEKAGETIYFETKLGKSPYIPKQRAKDAYIKIFGGPQTVVIRG